MSFQHAAIHNVDSLLEQADIPTYSEIAVAWSRLLPLLEQRLPVEDFSKSERETLGAMRKLMARIPT